MIKTIKFIITSMYKLIKTILFLLFFIVNTVLRLFKRLSKAIVEKLRFSITFKITLTYVLIFIFIFTLLNIGIFISFDHFFQYNSPEDFLPFLAAILSLATLIGIVLIIFIGSKASRKLLWPIKTMTHTVKAITINDLDTRIDVSGSKDELKDLAKTFNDMMDRIQLSVEQQNQFVSDASHELRTPIAVIQGYADMLARWGKDDKEILEESISALQGEAENMKSLMEKLLFLARGDNDRQKIEKNSFKLSNLINDLIKETRIIDTNHLIVNDKNEDLEINADKKLIKEALRIFLDNSIKYTPSGGTISVNSYKKNDSAVISIEDTGIGISKDDLPYIFNRFYRADKSRTKASGGTGLGLAIAKWIIDTHNGKVKVWSKLEEGTTIRIELPLT